MTRRCSPTRWMPPRQIQTRPPPPSSWPERSPPTSGLPDDQLQPAFEDPLARLAADLSQPERRAAGRSIRHSPI